MYGIVAERMRGKLMSEERYVFEDVDVLIAHLVKRFDNPTPLKIQKGLYFLWAFYAATYGNIDYTDDQNEFNLQSERYPKELFQAQFEAWRYGPVLNQVYAAYKSGDFKDVKDSYTPKSENDKEVLSFIDDLADQINSVNDFGLVERSHQDRAWKIAFKDENHSKMNNETIKEDYIGYVKRQSQI